MNVDPIEAATDAIRRRLEEDIAPGVRGWYRNAGPDTIEIASIRATKEGSGDVGRYLDSLPRLTRVVVPFVTNPRLAGMLERRGFRLTPYSFRADVGLLDGDAWVREAKP